MTDTATDAWRLILAADACSAHAPERPGSYAIAGDCLTLLAPGGDGGTLLFEQGWHALLPASDPRRELLDLYLPLVGTRSVSAPVVAQLGQSLDGFIALSDGRSHYVTGPGSLVHLHRLRALSDCVIVGAGTVAADNPRLTTRRVPGAHPTRVIIDPRLRLPLDRHVFQDGEAPTLRVRAQSTPLLEHHRCAGVEELAINTHEDRLDLDELVATLRARGHRTLLVEGGGMTIAAFLQAGLLQRLHVVSAPLLIGAGRPGLPLPASQRLRDSIKPAAQVYPLDDDVLFDCDLR